jgi:hypothetical protein
MCGSLNKDTVDFFNYLYLFSASRHDDWVFPLLPEMQQKLRHNFLWTIYMNFLADYDVCIYTRHWELMKSVVVMSACLCYSWWWWRSDTLWATLIRLWLHSSSCCLQSNVLVISLESHRYVSGNDGRLFNGIRLCRCCAKVGMHC